MFDCLLEYEDCVEAAVTWAEPSFKQVQGQRRLDNSYFVKTLLILDNREMRL